MPFYTNGATGFVDVRDVAQAIVLLMESDSINERFILNGENLTFKEFFTLVAKALNKKPPFFKVSRLVTEIGWRINLFFCFLTGRAPALTRDTARTSQTISAYSTKKFSDRFNYSFIPVKDSIQNAVRWFTMIDK